jgi:hypothetical protein
LSTLVEAAAHAETLASDLRGLTLHEPWNWAILHAGKPVENRPVRLPEKLKGKWIALHAGKTYDHDGAAWIRKTFGIEVPAESALRKGVITALVRFTDSRRPEDIRPPESLDLSGRWAFGPWCHVVGEKFILPEPIPCRGMQGWWPVEPGDAIALLRLLREAGRQP